MRAIIAENECTHALITDPVDVEYISGFRSSNVSLLISPARLHLFTDFRYMEAAKAFCLEAGKWRFNLIEESNFKYLKRKLRPESTVGIQSNAISVANYLELERSLPKTKFVPLADELAGVSIQKLPSEIASVMAAAEIGDRAFKALQPLIRESMTELELARLIEKLCADNGSEKPAFDVIALFGERSALPHGTPSERNLRRGDFVLLDFGCTVNGFRSDMTRTLVFGEASAEQRNVYDTVLRAQRSACLAARAGMAGKDLDAVARAVIAESGYGDYFGHGTGHGVGLRIHEGPRLSKRCDDILLENSIVTIEPGIYIPDMGGVRIEDMVVLKNDGAETLTHSPRELIELPL